MRFLYTREMLDFLEREFKELLIPDLTDEFNLKFGLDKTEKQIRSAVKNHGFKCGRPVGTPKGTYRIFSQEEAEFIISRYKELSLRDLTSAFNKAFSEPKTREQIRNFTRNHDIKSGRHGRFEKGNKPWNDGLKGSGVCKPNSGSFKKGGKPGNLRPIGHERICTKDGYILIKVNEPNPYTGAATCYKAKHKVIWEAVNGPIPEGHVLIFLDGDKTRCELENLKLISQAENLWLNRHDFKNAPAELKPTLLALMKVEVKTFEMQREV